MDPSRHEFTPSGNLKKPSVNDMSDWVLQSWNAILESMVAKSFKKCCISNAMDGTEDDLIFEDRSDDDAEECEVEVIDDSDNNEDMDADNSADDDTDNDGYETP